MLWIRKLSGNWTYWYCSILVVSLPGLQWSESSNTSKASHGSWILAMSLNHMWIYGSHITHQNPSCRASSKAFVSGKPVHWPIGILWGVRYGCGLGVREAMQKGDCSKQQWRLRKRSAYCRCCNNISYIRTGEHLFIERQAKNRTEGFAGRKRCFSRFFNWLWEEFGRVWLTHVSSNHLRIFFPNSFQWRLLKWFNATNHLAGQVNPK